MNAKNVSRIGLGLSLTLTALLLCGAPVLTTSCAGDGGGSGGGQGGAAGGQGGGQGGGSGGGGGSGCSDPATDAVNFCSGKAQGVMTGYAFIALGIKDTATQPVCAEDPNDLTNTRLITAPPVGECDAAGKTCPVTGRTVWKNEGDLCISGTIPKVTGEAATMYKENWGLQIGVNTTDPPATAAGAGTLGKTYSTIALSYTGTVAPENKAIRAVIHLVSQACSADPYCATIRSSGGAMDLTSFNTECWGPTSAAKTLTAADIPNIDKVGIQISSDVTNEYSVTDFCLTGIQFGN